MRIVKEHLVFVHPGEKFGRLEVVGREFFAKTGIEPYPRRYVGCLCDCCENQIKGNYGSVCEDCWSMRQQGLDSIDTRRAKIGSPHMDLDERGVRGSAPVVMQTGNLVGREWV